MRTSSSTRSAQALTLLEVLLAMSILLVLILSLFLVFTQVLKLQALSNESFVSGELGAEFLERVKKAGFASIPPGTHIWVGENDDPVSSDGFPFAPYPKIIVGDATYFFTVMTQPDPKFSDVVSVRVEVSSRKGRSTKMETYLTP